MAQLINEAKRMQLLAGLITESQLNEEPREGVYNDFGKWKSSFPEGTEFKQQNNYMVAFDKDNKELGKWNPSSLKGMHADDFRYKNLEEVEVAEVKVGSTYIAQMPTSNDGKERIDVKVKVLGPDKQHPDHFVIEFLEDKDYVNPVSKGQNRYKKGDHNGIEAKYLKPAGANESLDIESIVNEALSKLRK